MKYAVLGLAAVLSAAVVFAAGTTTPAQVKPVKATGWAAKLEQMVQAMVPQEKLDKMAGFFAPVVKNHMQDFNQFQGEYQSATQKLPVLMKYLPKAESALAEAKEMKVPDRYEAEKAEYIGEVEALLTMTKMSVKLANKMKGTKK